MSRELVLAGFWIALGYALAEDRADPMTPLLTAAGGGNHARHPVLEGSKWSGTQPFAHVSGHPVGTVLI